MPTKFFVAFVTLLVTVPSFASNNLGFRAFDSNGVVTTAIGSNDDSIRALRVQSDGKIVAAGRSHQGTYNDFMMARFLSDGSLDTTFSLDGKATYTFPLGEAIAHALTIDSSGRYILAGRRWGTTDYDFGVSRILSDGSVDTSFATAGHLQYNLGASDFPRAVAMDGSKIIVAGYTGNTTLVEGALMRLNGDGSLDTSFDTDGIVITNLGVATNWEAAYSLEVDSAGRYVVGGRSRLITGLISRFWVGRYNNSGALDASFSGDGSQEININNIFDTVWSITIDPLNRILATGRSATVGGDDEVAIVRLQTDGSLDNTFSGDGQQTLEFSGNDDSGRGVIVASNGDIFVGGTTNNGTNSDVFLAKYTSDGALDVRFDGDGTRTIAVGTGEDRIYAMAISPDENQVYLAGRILNANYDGLLVRINRSGSPGTGGILDPAFDSDGIQTVNFSGGNDESYDFDIDSMDRLVVFGRDGNQHVVTRYNTDGSLDTVYGTAGKVEVNIAGGTEVSFAGLIQPDGKAVGAGQSSRGFAAYRLLTDGSLDNSFDGNGEVNFNQGANNSNDVAYGIALDTLNRIVLVGDVDGDNWGVARLNTDGSQDNSFSGDGELEINFGGTADTAYDVAVQGDKIIVVGGTGTDFAVARLLSDGSLDTSFSTDGLATFDIGTSSSDEARGISIGTDGQYVVSGTSDNDFATIRVRTDGNLDTAFSTDGMIVTDIGTSTTDTAYDVRVDSDNRIIVVGESNNDFAVVAYLSDGSLDNTFAYAGKLTVDIDAGSTDEARAVNVDSQNRIVVVGIGGSVDFAAIRILP